MGSHIILVTTLIVLLSFTLSANSNTLGDANTNTENLLRAKYLLENNPLIDGHNDISYMIRENFKNKLDTFDLEDMKVYLPSGSLNNTGNVTHTDLKRLAEGRLGGQFWAVN